MNEAQVADRLHCLGPLGLPSQQGWTLPSGAWDTHFHVLGPKERFPYAMERRYTPDDVPLEACQAMHRSLGIERGFVVHPNLHGFDNSVNLDAIERSGGRYLGVVRLDRTVTASHCRDLHAAGVRGVRFAFNPAHGGALDRRTFDSVLSCVTELDWFIDLHPAGFMLPELQHWIESIPAQVVIDHFGRVDISTDLAQAPVRALLALAEKPNIWIKVSGADRISAEGPPYNDVLPLARLLGEVCPQRLLWGSDWPHTGYFDRSLFPDVGVLLDVLMRMFPDPALRERILVRNPVELLTRCGGDPLSLAEAGADACCSGSWNHV